MNDVSATGVIEMNLKLALTFWNDIFKDDDKFYLKVHFQNFLSNNLIAKKVFPTTILTVAPGYNDEHFTNINPEKNALEFFYI